MKIIKLTSYRTMRGSYTAAERGEGGERGKEEGVRGK